VYGNITQNTTWYSPVHAIGEIIVPGGKTLTVNNTVKFDQDSKIIVQPGGNLVVNGGTLTNACTGKLWQGIIVEGNGNQPQTSQYQGTVELYNATIENAECAIRTVPYTPSQTQSLGIIKANNTVFRNNLCAVEYCPAPYLISISNNAGSFTNCTFTINNNNLFATNNKTFLNNIKMTSVRGISFGGTTFKNETYSGGIGINAFDSGFNLNTPSCISVMPNYFYNLSKGICSNNAGSPNGITIDSNYFSGNDISVEINSLNGYQLTRNEIDSIIYCGLKRSGSSGYKIEENTFMGMFFYPHYSIGIEMNNSGIAENIIYRNSFFEHGIGILVQGINGFPLIPTGLQFLCNSFMNYYYDIYVDDGFIRRVQGSIDFGSDNKFMGPSISSSFNSDFTPIEYYHSDSLLHTPINPINFNVNN
jgi:hypothetical protein